MSSYYLSKVFHEDEDSGTEESDKLKRLSGKLLLLSFGCAQDKPHSYAIACKPHKRDSHWHCMMPPERKKNGCQRLLIDRLSNLPENVINSILMRLPLQDAVMTSILSKKWRVCLWNTFGIDGVALIMVGGGGGWWVGGKPHSYAIAGKLHKRDSHWHCMMPPERRKSGRQRLPIDRLSNLPKNVINSILMRLPLEDAVMTNILSKKWCRLPQLTLDDDLWQETRALLSPSIKFTKIMYQILTLHSGPLTKFTLSISALRKYLKIYSLIYFLSRNDIQGLVLKFSEWNRYRLPPSFFTCSQSVPLLSKLCLPCQKSIEESEKCDFDKFFQLLSALEHLYLANGSDQFLVTGAAEVPRRLSSPLNYLKRFNITLCGLADFSIALCLIRSSPFIQDIEMEVSILLEASNEVDEVLASFSDVTLNHLRTVQLKGVEGLKLELQLIKLLLTKSPMLV
ncbi:hypothetical protein MTR67_046504 [Solanum verrucosum]|uniref:F-box domain-containing protein n=1 Tax=Solanum verrucosum TaxID=315347 RepID=A0AAF0ZY08_SOLVR|nr:hypothetical protein MTR67_046504 [Solanum verrucosum]